MEITFMSSKIFGSNICPDFVLRGGAFYAMLVFTLQCKVNEAAMTIFDLLLILMVLGSAAACVFGVVALALRRWKLARWVALAMVLAWAVYLGVGTVMAVMSPQRIMALGENRCFDEMCFAVTG